jgi:hypothetical protein
VALKTTANVHFETVIRKKSKIKGPMNVKKEKKCKIDD